MCTRVYNNADNVDTWEHTNSDVGDRFCMARASEQLLGEVVLSEKYYYIIFIFCLTRLRILVIVITMTTKVNKP